MSHPESHHLLTCTGCKAANKDELLEMITHGAEKIVNSSDGYAFQSVPSLAIQMFSGIFIVSKSTTISMQLSSVVKSAQQSSTINTRV
jgi:hypothetical protein